MKRRHPLPGATPAPAPALAIPLGGLIGCAGLITCGLISCGHCLGARVRYLLDLVA